MKDVDLSFAVSTGRAYAPYVKKRLLEAIAHVRGAPGEISVALVGDARMSALHEQFMGIPGPTDVLTFELEHDDRGRVTAGEIVVCVPEAVRRARQLGHEVRVELLLYALHGVLHLAGYDDRNDADYRRMHRAEDRILSRIGIGPVFAKRPKGTHRKS